MGSVAPVKRAGDKHGQAYQWLCEHLVDPGGPSWAQARRRFGVEPLAAAVERVLVERPQEQNVRIAVRAAGDALGRAFYARLGELVTDAEVPHSARAYAFAVLEHESDVAVEPASEDAMAFAIDHLADLLWQLLDGGADVISAAYTHPDGEAVTELARRWADIPAAALLVAEGSAALKADVAGWAAQEGGLAADLGLQSAAEGATLPVRHRLDKLRAEAADEARVLTIAEHELPGPRTPGKPRAWMTSADGQGAFCVQLAVPWRFGVYTGLFGAVRLTRGLRDIALMPRHALADLARDRQDWSESAGPDWVEIDVAEVADLVLAEAPSTPLPLTPVQLALIGFLERAADPDAREASRRALLDVTPIDSSDRALLELLDRPAYMEAWWFDRDLLVRPGEPHTDVRGAVKPEAWGRVAAMARFMARYHRLEGDVEAAGRMLRQAQLIEQGDEESPLMRVMLADSPATSPASRGASFTDDDEDDYDDDEDDDDDEVREALSDENDTLIERFADSRHARGCDLDRVHLLLEHALDVGCESAHNLDASDVTNLFKSVLPRHHTCLPDEAEPIAHDLRAFFIFLDEASLNPNAAACAAAIDATATRALARDLGNPRLFGPAKRLFMAAIVSGVRLATDDDVERYVERVNRGEVDIDAVLAHWSRSLTRQPIPRDEAAAKRNQRKARDRARRK